jgi:hypothetical protein
LRYLVLGLALASLTCAFPTDKSDEVTVVIQAPKLVVIRGEQLPLFARAFRVSGADTLDVKNVVFQWTSGNSNLATVQDDGGGYAQVTGVNSGTVEIMARASAFEQADLGSLQVRVSNPLEVDSVRPSLVRFGDTITVYGVGVDSIFIAFLENATQFDYPLPGLVATRTRDSLGFATATFWVTPPAHTTTLSFIGPGVFGNAPDTTRVQQFDVLEPNQTAPRLINLDAAPRFPLIPQIKFLNPALAFEVLRRDETFGVDWYRFAQTATRDLTLILSGPDVRGTFSTFLTDSLAVVPGTPPSYTIGPSSWTIGPGSHFCKGFAFEPAQTQPESTIVALRSMPAGPLHAIAFYAQPGRYGLAVFEGYVRSDPAVPPDTHEEDDFCDAPNVTVPVVSVPTAAFRDTLTIDNPHDVDWIRFRVGSLSNVTIKTASLTGATADTSDVDIFLLTVPGSTSPTLDVLAQSIAAGSTEQIIMPLAAGDYYLVAVDFQGAPVAYDVCINATGCIPFPSPPASSAIEPTRSAPALRKAPVRGLHAPRPKPYAPFSP